MNKYKITVYAIAKNEEKFVDRWVNSMKEADQICVLDTGSNDNTVEKLKKLGVKVKIKQIKPWRFDTARNESLKLISKDTDICVCTDLDEIFEKGWRTKLENSWTNETTRASYTYNWSHNDKRKPIISFYSEKIHSLKDYYWKNPVHEVLNYVGDNENKILIDKLVLDHYPDNTKSRSSYLSLLELSVNEDPNNDRNMHYLGREYMYYEKWNQSIDTLIKHLNLKSSTWKDERCASMRFISRCYQNLNRPLEAEMWLIHAIEEAPYLRDPYIEMAILKYKNNNYEQVEYFCKKALEIKLNGKTYINEPFSFDETVYDLLSISTFYQNKKQESLEWIEEALKINPDNERIKNNKKLIQDTLTLT